MLCAPRERKVRFCLTTLSFALACDIAFVGDFSLWREQSKASSDTAASTLHSRHHCSFRPSGTADCKGYTSQRCSAAPKSGKLSGARFKERESFSTYALALRENARQRNVTTLVHTRARPDFA